MRRLGPIAIQALQARTKRELGMSELIKRKKRMQLMLLFAASFGCTCASVSGTIAALSYTAEPYAQTRAERFI